MRSFPSTGLVLACSLSGLALAGCASTVVHYPNAEPTAVTAMATEAGGGAGLVFVSGQSPEPADVAAARDSAAYWGDTEAQARSALAKVEKRLRSTGLGMDDVVKVQVFLVGDPALQGRADSEGFGRAWTERFGGAAIKPARTVVQVAGLAHPGMLVEIDAIAARR